MVRIFYGCVHIINKDWSGIMIEAHNDLIVEVEMNNSKNALKSFESNGFRVGTNSSQFPLLMPWKVRALLLKDLNVFFIFFVNFY